MLPARRRGGRVVRPGCARAAPAEFLHPAGVRPHAVEREHQDRHPGPRPPRADARSRDRTRHRPRAAPRRAPRQGSHRAHRSDWRDPKADDRRDGSRQRSVGRAATAARPSGGWRRRRAPRSAAKKIVAQREQRSAPASGPAPRSASAQSPTARRQPGGRARADRSHDLPGCRGWSSPRPSPAKGLRRVAHRHVERDHRLSRAAQIAPERRRWQPVRRRAAHAHQPGPPLQVVVDPVILRRPAGVEGGPGRAGQPFRTRGEAPVGARPAKRRRRCVKRRCRRSSARSGSGSAASSPIARTRAHRPLPRSTIGRCISPSEEPRPRLPAGPERFRSQAASPRAPRQPARNSEAAGRQPSRQVASAIRRRRARSAGGPTGRR